MIRVAVLSCILVAFVLNLSSFAFAKEDALSEKIEQLTEWSLKKPVIRLNTDKFKQFVKNPPRNYSVVVMLTALNPQRQCQICRPANDEFQILAQSWRYTGQFSNKVFFAMVDFDDASEVFQMLKTASAPQFIHFPRKGKPKAIDHFDISRVGFAAEQMAKWVSERTEVPIRVFRPPNYSGILLVVLLVFMVSGLLYVKRNNLEFLYNRTSWSIFVIGLILIFVSGQMWNQIRGPPLVHRNPQTGQIQYFAEDSDFQFVGETMIVSALYGAVVLGFILMNEAVKTPEESGKKKASKGDNSQSSVLAIAGLLLVAIFFSMALSVFRSKYQGYPYSFLF